MDVKNDESKFYVYGPYGVEGIYSAVSKAVNAAYEMAGVVVNYRGDCVWLKGNRVSRNQIMAIKKPEPVTDTSSLAVCLDTILNFEGIMRNSQQELNRGKTVMDILKDNLESAQILDLTGCNLDSVLYYVNQDIPVLAMLENGEAVLITGFNDFNVVVMDPVEGTLEKRGMNDSAKWLEDNGNHFVTYIRME